MHRARSLSLFFSLSLSLSLSPCHIARGPECEYTRPNMRTPAHGTRPCRDLECTECAHLPTCLSPVAPLSLS